MRFIVVDTEVFAYDNVTVFKDLDTASRSIYHNDNDGVREYFDNNKDAIYVGANIKHYDQFILKSMACDFSPEEVKQLNDYIIKHKLNGWDYPPLKEEYFIINLCDLFDDMQQGLSLKAVEAHLGMNIEETQVDFDIDRPLTKEEIEKTIFYCSYDVDATEKWLKLRMPYIENKIALGQMAGISPKKALTMTNARLTAAYLSAVPKQHDDEREYHYPDNLRKEFIPQAVFDFFDRMHDKTISDKDLFSSKYKSSIGNCNYTLGFGGIHGDCGNAVIEETDDTLIINEDVASYYPHLMTINGYCSRSIPDPQIYADMLERRMTAKKNGDIVTANALKLVANTTYGAMLAKWNDLYDPLMGRSVCISGQLYLLELGYHLHTLGEENVQIVQMNTDGIMFVAKKSVLPLVNEITKEWQERTGFELERDVIKKVVQKDVNGYIEIKHNGSVKTKGGYLVRGIPKAGAFNINNNFTIVSKAVEEYFVNNTPVEDTIKNCNDIFSFQIIAKAGSKYDGTYHCIDGEFIPVQNVNRVYATKDLTYGTLYKIHAESGGKAKISNLPEHCLVDNSNKLDISAIDKEWYIKLANNYVKDFLGISRKIRRTNTRRINNIKKQLLSILEV